MPARLRVERGNPHQPVDAGLRLAGSRRRKSPLISSTAPLIPASSPSLRSRTSTEKPRRSAHRVYMRISISAQSCASVPPAPALISTWANAEIVGTGEQRPQPEGLQVVAQFRDVAVELRRHFWVGFSLKQLGEFASAGLARGQDREGLHPPAQLLHLLHDVLRLLLVVPERPVGHARFEGG